MPEQEPSIKHPSRSKATPQARPASRTTSRSTAGGAAKPAAPKTRSRAASTGDVRRTGTGDLAEHIRQRAYEIWEREGRPEGREQAHWEQAEREVAKARTARQQVAAG